MQSALFKPLLHIFLITAFFISTQAQSQNKIDSLLNVLKTAKEDTNKVNALNALGGKLSSSNPDTSIILANQALSLSEKATSKKHIADSYHLMALSYFMKGNYPSALENYFKAKALREELSDKRGIAKSLSYIGMVYYQQGDYSKALDYYFKALKIHEQLGNKEGIAKALGNIGLVYSDQGDYSKALDNYFKALKTAEELGDKPGIVAGLSNIGNIYYVIGDYSKSLDYSFKALKLGEETGNKYLVATNLGNIGGIYYEYKDYPKALEYHFKALKMAEEIGYKYGIALHLGNIGLTYYDQYNYPKALDYYLKALKLSEQLGDRNLIATHLGSIGVAYTKTGKFIEAEAYLKKTISLFDSIGAMRDLMRSEKSLSQLYDTTGRYKLALEHHKKAMVLKDTLFNQEKNKEITRKEMNYEFEKTQAEEKAVHNMQLAVADIAIKKQTLLKNFLVGGLALVLVLFFFIYNNYRTKQKLKLENIRNKIAHDLHDDIGSTLNSISIYSEVAQSKSKEKIPELGYIGESSRKVIDAMSDIVWTINPENDSFEKIIFRMRSHVYQMMKAKNIEYTFKADEKLNELSLPMQTRKNFYLIFKESVNNLLKYSNATKASILLNYSDHALELLIRDNGIGFDTNNPPRGNGLNSMKQRADEMKGNLKIESEIGKGTSIELNLKTI